MVLLENLRKSLHYGEAQAITIAIELSADMILIDETDGRTVALSYGLTLIGTLGILLKAKELGLIERIEPLMKRLQSEARFFLLLQLYFKK